MDIQVSICASANRVQFWDRFYNSLKGNTINWEVIFVGDKPPVHDMPPNFKWIRATVKPAQCYQISFWASRGELIHWTADDADYNNRTLNCPNTLDIAYKKYKEIEAKYGNDGKTVIAFRPFEDGGDVYSFHHYFGGCKWSPIMAPFALVPRKYLVDPDKGYDRNFVSGQAENSVIMDVYADGGRVDIDMDAKLYVNHRACHPKDPKTGKEKNDFRTWYPKDRERLENLWVKEGYGHYEKYTPEQLEKVVHISNKKLLPHEPFINSPDVCFKTQGEIGQW